jgi:hypothetical protein
MLAYLLLCVLILCVTSIHFHMLFICILRILKKRPLSGGYAPDGRIAIGDRFGDVYFIDPVSLELGDADIGHMSAVSNIEFANVKTTDGYNGNCIITTDLESKVRFSRFPDTHVVERILFTHTEFVGGVAIGEAAADNSPLLVTGDSHGNIALTNLNSCAVLSQTTLSHITAECKHLLEADEHSHGHVAVAHLACSPVTHGTIAMSAYPYVSSRHELVSTR